VRNDRKSEKPSPAFDDIDLDGLAGDSNVLVLVGSGTKTVTFGRLWAQGR
jgi:hypothetical protein